MPLKEQLGLKLNPVGIKVSEELLGKPIGKPEYFDKLVREAAVSGKTFIITNDKLTDPYSHVSLGFEEPKYIKDYEPRIKKKIKSVRIVPVEGADVVLFVVVFVVVPPCLEVFVVFHASGDHGNDRVVSS